MINKFIHPNTYHQTYKSPILFEFFIKNQMIRLFIYFIKTFTRFCLHKDRKKLIFAKNNKICQYYLKNWFLGQYTADD